MTLKIRSSFAAEIFEMARVTAILVFVSLICCPWIPSVKAMDLSDPCRDALLGSDQQVVHLAAFLASERNPSAHRPRDLVDDTIVIINYWAHLGANRMRFPLGQDRARLEQFFQSWLTQLQLDPVALNQAVEAWPPWVQKSYDELRAKFSTPASRLRRWALQLPMPPHLPSQLRSAALSMADLQLEVKSRSQLEAIFHSKDSAFIQSYLMMNQFQLDRGGLQYALKELSKAEVNRKIRQLLEARLHLFERYEQEQQRAQDIQRRLALLEERQNIREHPTKPLFYHELKDNKDWRQLRRLYASDFFLTIFSLASELKLQFSNSRMTILLTNDLSNETHTFADTISSAFTALFERVRLARGEIQLPASQHQRVMSDLRWALATVRSFPDRFFQNPTLYHTWNARRKSALMIQARINQTLDDLSRILEDQDDHPDTRWAYLPPQELASLIESFRRARDTQAQVLETLENQILGHAAPTSPPTTPYR